MRISLPIKLMVSYLLVAGLIAVPSFWFLRRSLSSSLESAEVSDLEQRVAAVRDRLLDVSDNDRDARVRDMAQLLGLRITVIAPSGLVLDDSEVAPERVPTLENHHDRPEVLEALAGRFGYARRVSATVGAELIYGALPLPASGTPRLVVRVARRASGMRDTISRGFLAMRLAGGVGVSAAIVLSLIAALFVSFPLRSMRDAARAFAQFKWVHVKRLRTGDELEDLSLALDELGQKLREQLVAVGAQEALVMQACEAFPLPAILLRPDLQPMVINGPFRHLVGMTAANEGLKMSDLAQSPRLLAARRISEESGLPTELALIPPGAAATDGALRSHLVPLARPDAPPLWLLLVELERAESEGRGHEALQRYLHSAELIVERLWAESPEMRPQLAQLQQRLDEAAAAAGTTESMAVEPVDANQLVERCADAVRALYPTLGHALVLDGKCACKVAESTGLGARAMRLFLAGALRALPPGRQLEVTLETLPTEVRVHVEGAAPNDLKPIRDLVHALGTDVGRVPQREREAAWLSLPRA